MNHPRAWSTAPQIPQTKGCSDRTYMYDCQLKVSGGHYIGYGNFFLVTEEAKNKRAIPEGAKWAKSTPVFWPKRHKNHTLWDRTHLLGALQGSPHPPTPGLCTSEKYTTYQFGFNIKMLLIYLQYIFELMVLIQVKLFSQRWIKDRSAFVAALFNSHYLHVIKLQILRNTGRTCGLFPSEIEIMLI